MAENPVIAQHSLAEEIDRFRPGNDESGRRADILVKEDDLRVTLVTMRSGIELAEHSVPVTCSIQVLQGQFDVIYDGGSTSLNTGDFISLEQGARHTVRATEDGAFLLTIGWSKGK